MDHRMKLLWTFVVALTGLTTWASAQLTPANVPVPEVAAKVGYSANFSCESFGAPIVTCLWERRNTGDRQTTIISFDATARNGQPSSIPGYSYLGSGLDRGSCGIVISVVRDEDNAKWDCTLISGQKGLFRGTVDVNILKKPTPPQFFPNVQQIVNLVDPESSGQKIPDLNLACASANGQPPPRFKWYIGEQELTVEDGIQPYQTSNDTRGNIVTSQELQNYKFTWRDNGKFLRCVVDHEGLLESDAKEVAQLIGVAFVPKANEFDESVFVPSLGESATLAINVSSHPKPDINWEVDGEAIRPTSTSKNGRYKALSIPEVAPGVFECKLVIDPVEDEDLQKIFRLVASNQLGRAEFELRVSSSSPSSAGLGAGGIIGLVLGIPAILILIAVVLVYTRARGLLCFKGDEGSPSEKERMDEDGSVPVEEKQPAARRISSRLSAIYENLVAKKKDKTALADEEAGKEKESGETTTPSASDEKKPEDIVYAELDLTLEGGNGKPGVIVRTDDKTEYAEIVGVVPQVQNLDETKKERSPAGSKTPSPKK